MRKRDTFTIDMFKGFEPSPVVARYAEEQVRAATMAARMARAVTATLKAAGDRAKVAGDMSKYLGERVTENMLNQYASQANAQHTIPAHRLIALAIVTGDARLINALLTDTGLIAVEAKYEQLIDREVLREEADRIQRKIAEKDAKWRAQR